MYGPAMRSEPKSRRWAWLLLAALLLGTAILLIPRRPPAVGDERTPAGTDTPPPSAAAASPSVAAPPPADPQAPRPPPGFRPPAVVGTPRDEGRLIRLVTHTIDTSARTDAGAPATEAASVYAGVRAGAWIVQFSGPVRAADKQAVADAGGTLCGYVPNNAFAVKMDGTVLAQVAALPCVQWIGPYKPAYKVQPSLAERTAGDVVVDINTFTPGETADVAAKLAEVGAEAIEPSQSPRFGRVRARIPVSVISNFSGLDSVRWIEEHLPNRLLNNRAVEGPRLNVTNVWSGRGLTGSNQVIAVADTGLDKGSLTDLHTDFVGRVKTAIALGRPGDWSDTHGHGTHVCGSVLGDGTASAGKYRGVAWQAQLVIQSVMDSGGGLGGLPSNLNDLFLQAYTNGARVHSDSWGSTAYGFYTSQSRDVDEFTWDHPDMLVCIATGNDGSDNDSNGVVDFDSMNSPATAKNSLSVGAAENDHAAGEASGYRWFQFGYFVQPLQFDYTSISWDGVRQGMAAFSSRGPCDDGRIKPDLIAPGTDVISTKSRLGGSGWGIAPDNGSYMIDGGTSMSTPLVAGCASLVRQYFSERAGLTNPGAALVKAALINGARSLQPGQYGTGASREIPDGPRPNNVEGWGQVNLEDTLFPAAPASLAFYNGSIETGGTNVHIVNLGGTNACRVTLCWSDFPASPGSSRSLVNDLDLAVIGPDGVTNFASGMGTPDRTNNVEGVDLASPAAGTWRIEIRGRDVPEGPQPYALVLGGPVAPVIAHTPLANTTNAVDAYAVAAEITSAAPVDTNQLFLLWNTDGSANFTAVPLSRVSNDTYRGFIPAQPLHTTVHYHLTAATNGLVTTDPADAPATLHRFNVTTPVTLTVSGTPALVDAVVPAYGVHTLASGNTVNASAPAFGWTTNFNGHTCTGWTGSGSVPSAGATNAFVFTCAENSTIAWRWRFDAYGLVQSSTPAGLVSTTTWWNAGAFAVTVAAPATGNGTDGVVRFTGWYLDGLRMPDAQSVAVNPVSGITMARSHTVRASYLPEDLDADANGLADWWEAYFFGTSPHTPGGDPDLDGFSNTAEAADHTNPRNASSVPVPPVIAHEPPADPQTRPAPFALAAIVTDNCSVASVQLRWQRNAGAWNETAMAAGPSNAFTGSLPAPGEGGDTFTYLIVASDAAGYAATNGPHVFSLSYPVMFLAPVDLGTNVVASGTTGLTSVAVGNTGVGALMWTATVTKIDLREDVETGTNGWSHSGQNDLWHISHYRTRSGTNAWYMGNDATHLYLDRMDARLLLPPLRPGSNAVLRFWQWFGSEYDNGVYFWDGGIVEASTNNGASFVTIDPVGGYPYGITPNPDSPFPGGMPCLAGTGGWEQVAFDLAAFAGQDLRLRFRFGSDFYTVAEGWYLDDIEIVSDALPVDWLTVEPASGLVAPASTGTVALSLSAAVLSNAGVYRAVVRVAGNDPVTPTGSVTVAMRVDTRPSAAFRFAGQSPANGSGTVTISNAVSDVDGDTLSLRLEFSTDGGTTWTNLPVASAAAAGGIVISNAASQQLSGIVASPSNAVVATWSTTNAPALAWQPDVRIRATPSDGWISGATVTSAPFTVDNVAPSATDADVTVALSAFGNYVVGSVVTSAWTGFTDTGSGIGNYLLNRLASPVSGAVTATSSPAAVGGLQPGATNTVHVWARDAAGNIGGPATVSFLVLDPAGDADGDGFGNAAEEIAGTDALDAASVLRLTGAASGDGADERVLRWPYASNRTYALLMLSNLFDVPFFVMTNPPVVVTNGTAVFNLTNAPPAPELHFRLGVQPAP